MDYIYILGVKLHKIKKDDILKKIKEWLDSDKFHYITTVNPEFVLESQKNKEFKEILNHSDLSIPDGIGLKFAAWFFGQNIYRTAGVDLVKDILGLSEHKNCSIYFFVWKDGLSGVEEVKKAIVKLTCGRGWDRYSASETEFALGKIPPNPPLGKGGTLTPYPPNPPFGKCGTNIDGQAIERDGRDINWEKFYEFNPDILLVGLGALYQEKLIAKIKNQKNYEYVKPHPAPLLKGEGTIGIKVAIGVGGTFDFLTGKIRRAPKIMRMVGLEWLWRLIQQPKKHRMKRIFNAVAVFPWNVVKWKIRMSFKYRRGATAVIINKENKILLCQRADDPHHWQFPKGGVERSEKVEVALMREIYEEVGLRNIKIIKKLDDKDKYSYNYPRHQGNLIKSKYGFKGQISDIFIVKFLGGEEIKTDNKEFAGYKWVNSLELLNCLHPFRKKVGAIVLKELEKISKI